MPEVENMVRQPQPDSSAHIGALREWSCSRRIPQIAERGIRLLTVERQTSYVCKTMPPFNVRNIFAAWKRGPRRFQVGDWYAWDEEPLRIKDEADASFVNKAVDGGWVKGPWKTREEAVAALGLVDVHCIRCGQHFPVREGLKDIVSCPQCRAI